MSSDGRENALGSPVRALAGSAGGTVLEALTPCCSCRELSVRRTAGSREGAGHG